MHNLAQVKVMDKKTLKNFEGLLLKEKKRLENELARFTKRNIHNAEDFDAKFPQYGDEEDENIQEVSTYSDYLALEKTVEKDLQDVNSALKKVKDGTYGICKYCGKPIPEKRLLARPSSTSCVSCKKLLTQEV
ncbi:MAG: hypothetical protein ACD_32C00131G0003 [uncultured bacterium]|uniref:Transcriptional regulator, TraR/DksA family n=1 Tax=Candidatus Magasanikbacteria bacterium GW2011_GWA2_42_32 TaxID=1619039 RepID=A0A0G1CEW8_9BACT|nr:MAG: hypothetical protein ACD_32C00131G0003 [uncultured bacterium]KKR48552.1 MAG: Transcriptional regulator, TraR/DksA family [Candidatus Magasanikbacteria bacterium GW2011_GWC2_40_17]KKS57096.1 MAG: Transcriptional regulator, TraR/DksA family [Candidatus Magasanikbacteria bacterium GW2011_GWA2_42_32]